MLRFWDFRLEKTMPICPHCNQEIEFVEGRKTSVLQKNITPGLGCGSLLAIAIIVMFFSNSHSGDILQLKLEVTSLEKKIDSLTTSVNRLQKPLNAN
jgi:hypothetical protein